MSCPARAAAAFQLLLVTLLVVTLPSATRAETALDVGADWTYVRQICFSPDGSLVAAAVDLGDTKTVVAVWKRATAERIATFELEDTDPTRVQFSPDGRRLISIQPSTGKRRCYVWNLESQALERRLVDDSIWTMNATFSADGKRLATGNGDRTIKWWSLKTGEVEESFATPLVNNEIAASPDGKLLAADFQDGTIRVWTISGREVHRFAIDDDGDYPSAMTFSPDSSNLTIGSREFMRSWDLTTGKSTWREKYFERDSLEAIALVSYAPEGKRLVAFADDRLFVIDPDSGRKISEARVEAHRVAISPDWQWIVAWRSGKLLLEQVPEVVRSMAKAAPK